MTGDEPMTGPQGSYPNTLAREAGTDVPSVGRRAEASEKIEELQEEAGRGKPKKRATAPTEEEEGVVTARRFEKAVRS